MKKTLSLIAAIALGAVVIGCSKPADDAAAAPATTAGADATKAAAPATTATATPAPADTKTTG